MTPIQRVFVAPDRPTSLASDRPERAVGVWRHRRDPANLVREPSPRSPSKGRRPEASAASSRPSARRGAIQIHPQAFEGAPSVLVERKSMNTEIIVTVDFAAIIQWLVVLAIFTSRR